MRNFKPRTRKSKKRLTQLREIIRKTQKMEKLLRAILQVRGRKQFHSPMPVTEIPDEEERALYQTRYENQSGRRANVKHYMLGFDTEILQVLVEEEIKTLQRICSMVQCRKQRPSGWCKLVSLFIKRMMNTTVPTIIQSS